MITAIFSQAFLDYVRLRKVLPWLFLGLICLLLTVGTRSLDKGATPLEQYSAISGVLVFRLEALASAIFTTAIISQEVEGRTIVYLLTRPVPRWKLLLTRYVASVSVVSLLGIMVALFTSIGAYGGGFLSNPQLYKDLWPIVLAAASYGALFLFVSLIVNRALIICVLFAFGWETSIPSMQGDLFRVSIYSYIQSIADHPTGNKGILAMLSGNNAIQNIPSSQALMVLGGLIAVCLAASAWWFTHFEFVPREDAE